MGEGRRRHVCNVVNRIGATSMPYNEFVQYRRHREIAEINDIVALEAEQAPVSKCSPWGRTLSARGSVWAFLQRLHWCLTSEPAPSVFHLHQPKTALLFYMASLAALRRPAVVHTVHTLFSHYSLLNKMASILTVLLADRTAFVSQAAYSTYPRIVRRIGSDRMAVVRNGVDLRRIDRWHARRQRPEAASDDGQPFHGDAERTLRVVRMIAIGRLVRQKDHDFMLRIVAQMPDSRLVIVGSGPLQGALAQRAIELHISDRVRFVGLVDRERVYELIEGSDLAISTSDCEGLPIAALECMALGRHVLLSDIAPHREIQRLAPAVAVLSKADPALWVGEISECRKRGRRYLIALGRRHREAVERNFSLDAMHREYTKLYDQVAGGGRR